MTERFPLEAPYSGEAIIDALLALEERSHAFLAALPSDIFFAPQGDRWSPADHTRHLTKSIGAVAKGLVAPKLVVRMLYGVHVGPSRDLATVTAVYRARLSLGVSAGKFAPEPRPTPSDRDGGRAAILGRFRSAGGDLRAAIQRWDAKQLDRLHLPHPALGKLTVREMCLFTLYHNAHHMRLVAERLS
ncbi:MAG: DinB family protein [Gemmatimonadota bacterium]